MAKHLLIGGSTAARTIACPGWIDLSKNMPKQKGNVYADEGNLLHDAMEDYYKNFVEFDDMIDKLTFNEQVLSKAHVVGQLEPARMFVEEVLDKYQIEQYLCEPFVEIVPGEQGGSIDMLGLSHDYKTVLVLDYKFGSQRVKVEDNKQLQFYALSAKTDKKTSSLFDEAENVVYCIIQPKCASKPLLWESSVTALDAFKRELDEALANRDRVQEGEHCKYCPAMPICPAKRKEIPESLQKFVDKK